MKQNLFRVLSLAIILIGLVLYVYPVSADDRKPVPSEIISERTENSKTYDNHDGTRGLTTYIGVVHYKDDYANESEQWKDIDTTIVNGRVDKAPYVMSVDYATGVVTIKDKKTGAITTIGIRDIEGESVGLINPVESGNIIKFADVVEDTDIVIEATSTHVRFKRVLKSDDAPKTATFAIYQKGEGITVTPLARDVYYADVKVDSELKDGILTESLAMYKKGELAYPVEIDPSIDVRVTASTDDTGYIFWNGAAWQTFSLLTDPICTIGYNDPALYRCGGGLRFQNVNIPQSSTISTAYINVTPFAGGAFSNNTVCVQLGNSATFSTLADYQARRGTDVGGASDIYHTANFTYMNNIGVWTANVTYQFPSIVSCVQEAVSNATWQNGYAMTLFLDDHKDRTTHINSYIHQWYTYDFLPASAPLLHIDYTVNNVTMNTLRCTGFGDNWLLFNGNVTAYGGPINITQLGFDYGATTAYGSSAVTTYTNYTLTSYGYYQYVNNLNAATMYNFRAKGWNSAGWGYGPNRQFSTGGTSVEWPWEMNISTLNTTQAIYGSNWAFQRFTTNVTAHTLTSVDLWLSRIGTPGDVTVVTQAVGVDGLPYGAALNTGTIAGQYTGNINPISTNTTARYNVKFDKEVSLTPNTQYAITVKALMGDYNNYVRLGNVNSASYTYGSGYTSSTSGSVWADTGTSYLFDLWGRACLQVDQGRVFTGYKATGDWLFVFSYDNTYPPYYPIEDSKQYFVYQLVDYYNTVKAQTPCASWGVRPGSIYLSAASVVPLQWGGAYRLRLTNLRDGTVYMEYPLQSTDWLGSDMELLDAWCLSVAQRIGTFYNTPLTTTVAGRGLVLNQNGGVMFATGIPLLDSLRPNLFQIATQSGTPTTTNVYPQTMRQAFNPAAMLGPDAFATMTVIGNVFGVDGRTIGFAGLVLMTVIIAGWGFQPGHTIAATIIASIMFVLAMLVGLLDLLIGALLLAILFLIFVFQAIFRGG